MTTGTIDASQRRAARVAGIALLFATAVVVFGEFYVSGNLVVRGDAAQTARNVLAHETLFRITIACNVIYVASILVLTTALYVILQPVHRGLAMIAALCRFVFALMWGLTALNMLGALRFLGDANYLAAFSADQLQTLARVHIAANFDAYYVGLPFFGLASTICSWLWFKSRYVPRALAAFGVVASAWCVACGFVFIVFPHFNKIVNDWWFDTPMALFELAISFWLLFRGLRPLGPTGPAIDRVA